MSEAEINNLTVDELGRLFEMFKEECATQKVEPDLSSFHVWMQER